VLSEGCVLRAAVDWRKGLGWTDNGGCTWVGWSRNRREGSSSVSEACASDVGVIVLKKMLLSLHGAVCAHGGLMAGQTPMEEQRAIDSDRGEA
jgi:hypothetical protein